MGVVHYLLMNRLLKLHRDTYTYMHAHKCIPTCACSRRYACLWTQTCSHVHTLTHAQSHAQLPVLKPPKRTYKLSFSGFNGDGFIECLKQILRIDGSWIPEKEGYSMYIRPTAIGTSPFLGVHASEEVMCCVA